MKLSEFFDKPEKWCKGFYARAEDDSKVYAGSINACKWCLYGGVIVCGLDRGPIFDALQEIAVNRGYDNFVEFNDDPKTTFEDVKQLIKKAEEKVYA